MAGNNCWFNHDWSKWELIKIVPADPYKILIPVDGQKRECRRCGRIERVYL